MAPTLRVQLRGQESHGQNQKTSARVGIVLDGQSLRHPFAVHDDLIDAVSRIYDIDPQIPQIFESYNTDGPDDDDYEGEPYIPSNW